MITKEKRTFTRREAEEIRELLRRKVIAPREAQKGLRAKIRRLGFRISSFSRSGTGFTVIDFDHLVRSGRIVVVGTTF